jgi:hypothetical protein
MCGTIDPGHTYDEYLILHAKSGMTCALACATRGGLGGRWLGVVLRKGGSVASRGVNGVVGGKMAELTML